MSKMVGEKLKRRGLGSASRGCPTASRKDRSHREVVNREAWQVNNICKLLQTMTVGARDVDQRDVVTILVGIHFH